MEQTSNNTLEKFIFNDGGRAAAGYKGKTGDCVCRAICIATGKPYEEVYQILSNGNATQRKGKRDGKASGQKTASKGINVKRDWFKKYIESLGFVWTPTMSIGQGCKTHLKADELPKGNIICSVSKHWVAVIDGVINDTFDCSREGTRCVYGYYSLK
jgi:hypothetical protein